MYTRCCFSFVFLLLIHRVSLQDTYYAVVGGSAILPCSNSNEALKDRVTVYWRYRDSRMVYDIIGSEVEPEEQEEEFRGRVESFPEEWRNGNFAIRLSSLRDSDSGLYTCFIPEINTQMRTYLNVTGLLICWQGASGLTDMLVDLGQNVSLSCNLMSVKEVYWFIQKYPSPPKPIVRSFFGRAPPYFYDGSFRGKFSLHENLRLVIQRVTKNELGTLYCVETGNLNFSSGIRLYISEPTIPSPQPTQVTHQRTHCETPLPITISATFCCVVLAVVFVSGLMWVTGCRKRHPEDGSDEITVIPQKGGQNTKNTSRSRSTFTVVQFTQLSPAL